MILVIVQAVIAAVVGAVLYRLRGGWFRDLTGSQKWWNGSQAMRLIWSLPTAALIAWQAETTWLGFGVLVVTVFASLALIGHGAHMVYDRATLAEAHWSQPEGFKGDLELLTFWLPDAFGGRPNFEWPEGLVYAYHATGMSFIGAVRSLLAVLPVLFIGDPAYLFAALYAVGGLAHGPLYLAGWKLGLDSRGGELLVGAWTWFVIVTLGAGL